MGITQQKFGKILEKIPDELVAKFSEEFMQYFENMWIHDELQKFFENNKDIP